MENTEKKKMDKEKQSNGGVKNFALAAGGVATGKVVADGVVGGAKLIGRKFSKPPVPITSAGDEPVKGAFCKFVSALAKSITGKTGSRKGAFGGGTSRTLKRC